MVPAPSALVTSVEPWSSATAARTAASPTPRPDVVLDLHDELVRYELHLEHQGAAVRLPLRETLLGGLDAVIHRVANHVYEIAPEAPEGRALDPEPVGLGVNVEDALVETLGEPACRSGEHIQPLRQRFIGPQLHLLGETGRRAAGQQRVSVGVVGLQVDLDDIALRVAEEGVQRASGLRPAVAELRHVGRTELPGLDRALFQIMTQRGEAREAIDGRVPLQGVQAPQQEGALRPTRDVLHEAGRLVHELLEQTSILTQALECGHQVPGASLRLLAGHLVGQVREHDHHALEHILGAKGGEVLELDHAALDLHAMHELLQAELERQEAVGDLLPVDLHGVAEPGVDVPEQVRDVRAGGGLAQPRRRHLRGLCAHPALEVHGQEPLPGVVEDELRLRLGRPGIEAGVFGPLGCGLASPLEEVDHEQHGQGRRNRLDVAKLGGELRRQEAGDARGSPRQRRDHDHGRHEHSAPEQAEAPTPDRHGRKEQDRGVDVPGHLHAPAHHPAPDEGCVERRHHLVRGPVHAPRRAQGPHRQHCDHVGRVHPGRDPGGAEQQVGR